MLVTLISACLNPLDIFENESYVCAFFEKSEVRAALIFKCSKASPFISYSLTAKRGEVTRLIEVVGSIKIERRGIGPYDKIESRVDHNGWIQQRSHASMLLSRQASSAEEHFMASRERRI